MRNAFADELVKVAAEDERVVMLSADIGNRLFDPYKERFSERFFNCGVAEANTIGVAAGLAMNGLRPIAYTIAPFITYRCYEQIRVDVCYHNQPVIIVGVGAGLSYANLGPTHHSCEDIAALRALPNMTVLCPADPCETRLALRAALEHSGPVYIRLGKKGEPLVHESTPRFEIGKPILMGEGSDICILSNGTILPNAVDAAELLEEAGISSSVYSYHTVKPLNTAFLDTVFTKYKLVVTLEEHSTLGGVGSSVAEWLSSRVQNHSRLLMLGTPDAFIHEIGSQTYTRNLIGLDPHSIVAKIHAAWKSIENDLDPITSESFEGTGSHV